MSLPLLAQGRIVLFNSTFRESNLQDVLPIQYVDVDDHNVGVLQCGHYLEINLPAGAHRISLYSSMNDVGQVFRNYEEAYERGPAIHLMSVEVKNGEIVYLNALTGLRVSDVRFGRLLVARRPLQAAHPISLLQEDEPEKEAPARPSGSSLAGASDVDWDIPTTGAKNTKTFAVIVGNERYESVANVPYAQHDGAVVREYCMRTLGLPEQNIHLRENATLNNLRAELNWLKQVCEAYEGQANVLFYYAGHGIPDESSKNAYLLPVDGLGNDIATGYAIDDLYATLGAMPAKRVMVFMDACFSGSKREEGMISSARGVAIKSKGGQPQGNMVVFSAAQGDETAYPLKEEGHGLFTYYLLKKIQESKGSATLEELADYVTTNVRQQSVVRNGKSQTPTVKAAAVVEEEWKKWKL